MLSWHKRKIGVSLWAIIELSPSAAMDTLLLTVYFIVVFYVLYQMALSLETKLEDKVNIFFEENTLHLQTQSQLDAQPKEKQIEARIRQKSKLKNKKVKQPVLMLVLEPEMEFPIGPDEKEVQKLLKMSDENLQEYLHEKIIISLSPIGEQKLKPPIVFLSIRIHNDTADTQVYVDWDRSSIEMFGLGHRTIRSTPNMPVDLSRPQVSTVVNPGMAVMSKVTTEQKYNRDPETNLVKQPQPLVNLEERIALPKMSEDDKKEDEEKGLALYTLDLMVSLKSRSAKDHKAISVLIPFICRMKVKVDKPAFPPIRWMLRHFGRKSQSKSWILGGSAKRN